MSTSTQEPVPVTGLRERLRDETQDLHTLAEHCAPMEALIKGDMSRVAYVSLLGNLHAVYAALEPALAAHRKHPAISPIYDDRLRRLPALCADLEYIQGTGWRGHVKPTRTAREYATRLQDHAARAPDLLAAHAYVRYLGDLSGGQLLRKRVRPMLRMEDEGIDGTQFYEFGPPGATALARRFRAGLEAIPADEAQIGRLLAEARTAFDLHIRMFDELA
jgi:heme oxygenase